LLLSLLAVGVLELGIVHKNAKGADVGAAGGDAKALSQLLADITKARKGVRTLKASFVQERKLSLLATSVKSTGEFDYVAPDRLRWELQAPDDVVYFVGPEGLSYRTKTSKATLPETAEKAEKGLADLRAIVGGDIARLDSRYVLSGVRKNTEVEIAGVARDATANVRGFTLVLDSTLTMPRRVRLREGKTDSVEIEFRDVRVNTPVDHARMRP
jgi:outer membrane lipoprotein-sorting protein